MKKKLQIFISSTFSDLQTERQSAVEAVLRAGHIPAGMELFSAGNESQLEIIKRWIDESDVYMLILGGRYGSIEKATDLSYTEIEYQYALQKNKPVFAIVASESLLKAKVKKFGVEVMERKNVEKYDVFKELVLSKICRHFSDNNEIKLAILESILDIQSRFNLNGWVRFEEMPDISALLSQLSTLQDDNNRLKKEMLLKVDKQAKSMYGGLTFSELTQLLLKKEILVPKSVTNLEKDHKQAYLDVFLANYGVFNTGVDNHNSSGDANHLLYKIASDMMVYGLIEQKIEKRGQSSISVLRSSDDGKRFIAESNLLLHNAAKEEDAKKKATNKGKEENKTV